MRSLLLTLILVVSLPLAAAAYQPGQPLPPEALHGPRLMTAPSGVRYINGGFGAPERHQMLAQAAGFTLRLEFTEGGHPYVSGVLVGIDGRGPGRTLHLQNAGPMLLANLPPGSYRITGTLDGRTVSTVVNLGSGMQRVILRF